MPPVERIVTVEDPERVPRRLQDRLASEQNAVLTKGRSDTSTVEVFRALTMSKTKAGGSGDRKVDMRLRTECTIPQFRLTSRTFVSVGMAEIIKSIRIRDSGPASNQPLTATPT